MQKTHFYIIFLGIMVLFSCQELFAQSCGSRKLDPRIAEFLKMIGANQDMTIEQYRSIPAEQLKLLGAPPMPYPIEDVQHIKITADSIPVLIFNPAHKQNLPIIINYHPGGFFATLHQGFQYKMWEEAKTYNAIVFAIDYRVAPENKYPTAVNDCYNAFKWITEHGSEYGGDTSRLVLKGESAGANLVAVVSQKARNEGISNKIKLQIMNGLPMNLSPQNMESSASYQENENGYFATYNNDRFGFNNPDNQWDIKTIDYVLLGDSATHGDCVNEPDTIGGKLRSYNNVNSLLNLAQAGNDQLIEYATLKEYMPIGKIKNVLIF